MSHFAVLVVGPQPVEALAPFQENNMGDCPQEYMRFKAYPRDGGNSKWFDSEQEAKDTLAENFDPEKAHWDNPNKKWDWYELGGRWSDLILLKTGKKVNAAVKSTIDFNTMRSQAYHRAAERHQQIHAIVQGRPIPNWDNVRQTAPSIDAARESYNQTPVIIETRRLIGFFENLDEFDCSEEVYATKQADHHFVMHAFLKDGQWIEKGEMGWFGTMHPTPETEDWDSTFKKLLDSVADTEVISIYDCHI